MFLLKKLTNPELGMVKRPGLRQFHLPGTPDSIMIAGRRIPEEGIEEPITFLFRNFLAISGYMQTGVLSVVQDDKILTLDEFRTVCREHASAYTKVKKVVPAVPEEVPAKAEPVKGMQPEQPKEMEPVVEELPVKEMPPIPAPILLDSEPEAPTPADPVSAPKSENKPAEDEEPAVLPPMPKQMNKMTKSDFVDWLSTTFDREDLEKMTKQQLMKFAKKELEA